MTNAEKANVLQTKCEQIWSEYEVIGKMVDGLAKLAYEALGDGDAGLGALTADCFPSGLMRKALGNLGTARFRLFEIACTARQHEQFLRGCDRAPHTVEPSSESLVPVPHEPLMGLTGADAGSEQM